MRQIDRKISFSLIEETLLSLKSISWSMFENQKYAYD